ncbi:hypothetical protein A2716_04070 [candidate division WWE3 bacterium RIFCSPHIGHO2_01_FULL_40_23]|uniref:peptidylprolyl isomerase n=1 Tax=candidate division WWE3 bacterium RIFCSPLOWO2_01_FULL_41_18 TaxID=1802625 RepID=A0A1F4VCS6_UNCKA|nr:MAG: hypothetical protein A2716_04070 [candidate division WWE3 bacterium RIFCSPHIGHO2_01_FULL_40_23]OGC55052.1 MAG: hypothetical protein A3A78_03680 [candidate division WWE3 bacterium RIFCSPLOWO2_01_FULL_41_18]
MRTQSKEEKKQTGSSSRRKIAEVLPNSKASMDIAKPEKASATDSTKRGTGIFSSWILRFTFLSILIVGLGFILNRYKSNFVAAKVNGEYIYTRDLNKSLTERYGNQTLEDLITVLLIKEELSRNGLEASESEINLKLSEIEKTLNGTSLDQALLEQGMTLEALKERVSIQIGLEKLLLEKVTISKEEIDAFVTQYEGSLQSADDEGKRKEAENALREQKMQGLISTLINDLRLKSKVTKYI